MIKLYFLFSFFVLVSFNCLGCPIGGGSYNASAQKVSFIELVANKSKLNGKLVTISGILDIEPRNLFLFNSYGAYKHFIYENSFRVVLSSEQLEKFYEIGIHSLSGKFVSITGVYMEKEDGATSGFIKNVEQVCLSRVRD